jgi:hypothetical protein
MSGRSARSSTAPSPDVLTDFTVPTSRPRTFTSEPADSSLPVWSARSVTAATGVNAWL